MSELQRETGELERATLASVNTVAKRYAVPSGVTLVLVGDRSKIEEGIRELKLGDIVILDAEGKPLTR